MRRWPTIRRVLVVVGVVAVVAAVPFTILAAKGTFGGALDRQGAKWTTTKVSTSSTKWRNVPGLALTRCTLNQVTAMLSVTVTGAPVRFRVKIDDAATMKPLAARFVPNGRESFSYTFFGNTGPFEANDNHLFNVQWRSASGLPVTLERGAVNLLFQQGTQACP